jgi:hypothetical protein
MLEIVAATPDSRLSRWRIGSYVPPSDYVVLLTRDHVMSVRWHIGRARGYPVPIGGLELGLDASGASKLASVRREDRRRLLAVLVAGRLLAQTLLAKAVSDGKLTLVSTNPTATTGLLDSTDLRR